MVKYTKDVLESIKEIEFFKGDTVIIPEEIVLLRNLHYIRFEGIPSIIFPTSIEKVNLKEITIIDSNLRVIPEVLLIRSLEALVLINCNLDYIPSSIDRLENLMLLYLSHNNIRTVPSSITKLNRVVDIRLDHNNFQKIPLFNSNLQYLKLYNNLKDLTLSDNKIKEIPSFIFHMPNLIYLNFDNNPLSVEAKKSYEQYLVIAKKRREEERALMKKKMEEMKKTN